MDLKKKQTPPINILSQPFTDLENDLYNSSKVTSEDWRFCTWIDHTSVLSVHLWPPLGCCDPAGREALGLSTHTSYEGSRFHILGSMWPKSNNVRTSLHAWAYEELEDAKPNKFLIPHKTNEHFPDHTLRWLILLMIIYVRYSWYLWTSESNFHQFFQVIC